MSKDYLEKTKITWDKYWDLLRGGFTLAEIQRMQRNNDKDSKDYLNKLREEFLKKFALRYEDIDYDSMWEGDANKVFDWFVEKFEEVEKETDYLNAKIKVAQLECRHKRVLCSSVDSSAKCIDCDKFLGQVNSSFTIEYVE